VNTLIVQEGKGQWPICMHLIQARVLWSHFSDSIEASHL